MVLWAGPVEEVVVCVQLAAGVALTHVDHLLRGEARLAVCRKTCHVTMKDQLNNDRGESVQTSCKRRKFCGIYYLPPSC